MVRPPALLIGLAAIAAAPLPAHSQTWPATVASGASEMSPRTLSPRFTTIERDIIVLRPPGTAPTQPGRARRAPLILRTPPVHVGETPEVEVRPKAAWLDDQGLRLTPMRVAYRHRF